MVSNMKNILIALCFGAFLYNIGNVLLAPEPVYKYHNVIVASGDTMWDIAGRFADPGEDVREVVFRIAKANGLKNKTLYPGQVLRVPVAVGGENVMIAAK